MVSGNDFLLEIKLEMISVILRYCPMFVILVVISNVFLATRKLIQKFKEVKFTKRQISIQMKDIQEPEKSEQDKAKEHVTISFNNNAFNPEVINTKSFVIITSLTISIMICVAVSFLAFSEVAMNKFPLMLFLVRFILSVILPLIVYFNNSSLLTYVQDLIRTLF